ncbi:MAG: DinB family protein [Chloroflexota bacterium]
MRKAEVELLVGYMYWVNHRLLDAAERVDPGQFVADSRVTTRDLRATLVHELDVEWSWRLNLQGRPDSEFGPDVELSATDYPDVRTLREHWRRDEIDMRAWLESLTDRSLEDDVPSRLSGNRRPLWQYVMHIVTHAAQQQADAATLLTMFGQSPGELGLLEYLRSDGHAEADSAAS